MKVLITGGSRGIGKAVADVFAERQHEVFVLTQIDSVLDTQSTMKDNCSYIRCNYRDMNSVLGAIKTKGGNKPFDIVIHNAGFLKIGSLDSVTWEDFENHLRVNTWIPLELTRSLLSHGLLAKKCHVVNIGSVGGVQGTLKFGGLFSYSTSKAALASLTEFMDVEWGDGNRSFNYFALGAVDTEMLREAFPDYNTKVTPEKMAETIVELSMTFGEIASGKLIQLSKDDPES